MDTLLKYVEQNKEYIPKHKPLCKAITAFRDEIIGMERLKEKVCMQLIHQLRSNISAKKKGVKFKTSSTMTNMTIYGEPGMGKSTVASYIARVVYYTGVLPQSKSSKWRKKKRRNPRAGPELSVPSWVVILLVTIILAAIVAALVENYYGRDKSLAAFILVFVVGMIILIIDWVTGARFAEISILGGGDDDRSTYTSIDAYQVDGEDIDPDYNTCYRIISAGDMKGEFVGQSERIVKDMFADMYGKVLIIDEFYNLAAGRNPDVFGLAILGEVNLQMSQYPGDIFFIFLGYKDDIVKNVFSAQKGLPRRSLWHVELDPYTGEQLGKIFIQRVKMDDSGYRIRKQDRDQIISLISIKCHNLTGGDMQNIASMACMNATMRNVTNGTDHGYVLVQDIDDAIKTREQNEKLIKVEKKEVSLEDMLRGIS